MYGGYIGNRVYASRPKYKNRLKVLDCPDRKAMEWYNCPYYGINGYITNNIKDSGVLRINRKFSRVGHPSACILVGDSQAGPSLNSQASYPFENRHSDGANILYCDGHVSYVYQAEPRLRYFDAGAQLSRADRLIIWEGE